MFCLSFPWCRLPLFDFHFMQEEHKRAKRKLNEIRQLSESTRWINGLRKEAYLRMLSCCRWSQLLPAKDRCRTSSRRYPAHSSIRHTKRSKRSGDSVARLRHYHAFPSTRTCKLSHNDSKSTNKKKTKIKQMKTGNELTKKDDEELPWVHIKRHTGVPKLIVVPLRRRLLTTAIGMLESAANSKWIN